MAVPPESLWKDVRKFIFDHIRDRSVPPVLEQIMQRFRLNRPAAYDILAALERARHLKLVPGTQRILMAFPFSAIATPFRVLADSGVEYYANCAWDAVAMHATLEEPIRIESHCHHCAADLNLDLADGRVARSNAPEPLVHIALPAAKWWEDIVSTCSNHMVFFQSKAHLADWRRAGETDGGVALPIEQVHELGRPIYEGKLRFEYARPSKEQLARHFESLGLTGEFWRL